MLGVYLGPEDQLLKPGEENPKGFWEYAPLVKLNDEILSRLGGSWHELPAFEPGWESAPQLADLRQKALELIRETFASGRAWGWKDPRTCVTLAFWQRLLPHMRYVICLRNPMDVARSLQRRNGFSLDKGINLWLSYVQSALEHTAGEQRCFVFYEDFISNWQGELRGLSRLLGKPDLIIREDVRTAVEDFIDTQLQHHRTSLVDAVDDPKLTFPAKALFFALRLYVSLRGEEFDQGRALTDSLQGAVDTIGLYSVRAHTEVENLRTEVASFKDQLTKKENAVEELRAQLETREERVHTLQAHVDAQEQRSQDLLTQLAAAEGRLTAQLSARDKILSDITGSTAWSVIGVLWKVRLALAPHGSHRERVLRLMARGVRTCRREGLRILAKRAHQKIRRSQVGPAVVSSEAAVPAKMASLRMLHVSEVALPSPVKRHNALTHPLLLPFRLGGRPRQWLRTVLPTPLKRWAKRVMLRGTPAPSEPGALFTSEPGSGSNIASFARRDAPGGPDRTPIRSKYDVLCFALIDWHFRFQRPQHLARQFANDGHRVFYVSTVFTHLRNGTMPTMTLIQPGIYEVHLGPSSLNVYQDQLDAETLDRFMTTLEEWKREQHIVDAICFVQSPFWRPLATRLRDRFGWQIVYDCLDDHRGFSTNTVQMLAEEEPLIRASDLVVATSQQLYDRVASLNDRSILVPNAAEFRHFSVFVGEPPTWLLQLQRPIIGYFGAIADWVDTDLVSQLARLRPNWSFVLVGSTLTADVRLMKVLPNVYLTGEQPYAILPAYLHTFDVCIIPFKRIPLTEASNPVKFYEYLCAGKPIVSTLLQELRPYAPKGLVYLADDPTSFAGQIDRALAEDSLDRINRRMQFAENHTWELRYQRLRDAIQATYPKASIVIPTHSNLHLTRLCLESIIQQTTWPNYEIIVVDNASTDGTPAYLQAASARDRRIQFVLNEYNEGFARAVNQGIARAAGEYLVLLNNDTIVTRGWLTVLIRHLQGHPDIGLIGPTTNLAGNEAKINVAYTSVEELETFAEHYTDEHAGEFFEVRALGFFCAVLPRRVLGEVGLLDERFRVGMFEDDDFSLRLQRAGYRLVCADDAFVHHFHRATFKRLSEPEYVQLFDRNRAAFEQKWGITWTPHRYRWEH